MIACEEAASIGDALMLLFSLGPAFAFFAFILWLACRD